MTHTLVLVRHGQSEWNLQDLFTGWTDVNITEQGYNEAVEAGQALKDAGFVFDMAFTSVLKRAIRTLWTILTTADQTWIPIENAWQLNERHYGALQGLNKTETAKQYGDEQVLIWRRSYDTPPPPLTLDDPRHPRFDPRYASLSAEQLPATESLKECLARVLPYWEAHIKPQVLAGKRLIIAAHGNSLRALVKHLEGISDADILKLNIPTGKPLVYELADDLSVISKRYLIEA